jgi:FeS assembly SUF system protein
MSDLESKVIQALRKVFDPEIPVNIYDLGLIYELKVGPSGETDITMTLTAPNCPVAGVLPKQVEQAVRAVPGVTEVRLELVWEPAWDRDRMSQAARLELGFDLGFDIVPDTRLRT